MENNKFKIWFGSLVMVLLMMVSCNDELDGTTFFTTDDLTISETLEASPEKYSMYVEILRKTEFYLALRSYGNYTCLAPNNESITAFIQEKFGVSTVGEITDPEDINFLKILVQFHTIPTETYSNEFIEGRVADTTFTGDFLTTTFLQGGGISNVKFNRSVGINKFDIEADNGIIHELNGVLDPYIDPVTKVMEDAGKHSIFVEALKATGYYDTFSVIFDEATGIKNNFTVLAESDSIYALNNITSFQDLADLVSPGETNYETASNGLNRFIGYHVTENFLYTADFPDNSFINTILPKNAIKSFRAEKEVRLNEVVSGDDVTWTELISTGSNLPAKNGVYHTVNKILDIFVPDAEYVIFDFGKSLPEFQAGNIPLRTWVSSEIFSKSIRCFPTTDIRILTNTSGAYDGNSMLNLASVTWIEFDTPVLPKGKYELRVCGNQGNNGRPIFQISWDGVPIGSQWNMKDNLSEVGLGNGWQTDSIQLRNLGYIRGQNVNERADDKISPNAYTAVNLGRFIVIDDLLMSEQKSHVLRFQTISSGGIPIDYIEFVPVD